jgi:hypothetical protein
MAEEWGGPLLTRPFQGRRNQAYSATGMRRTAEFARLPKFCLLTIINFTDAKRHQVQAPQTAHSR